MTLDQFFDELAKTKDARRWVVLNDVEMGTHVIRFWSKEKKGWCCPITAICPTWHPSEKFVEAAVELGLSLGDAVQIANAADDDDRYIDLRGRLLSTLGLS